MANDVLVFTGSTNTNTTNDYANNTKFNGLTFASGASSFVLGGSNAVILGGDINDNSTNAQTINLPLALNGATVNVNVVGGGSLGLGVLRYGSTAQSPALSTLNINNSVSATQLVVQTNSASANTLNIDGGQTFTITNTAAVSTGIVQIGNNDGTLTYPTALAVSGAGSWNVTSSNSNFIVGVGSGNNNSGTMNVTLDMSNLSNFTFDTGTAGSGNLFVGYGTRPLATLRLANTSNTITAAGIVVGRSNQTPGFTGLGTNNNAGGTSTIFLGDGTNVINTNSITLGISKGVGVIQFGSGSGSVVIAGQAGGASTADITISNENSGSGSAGVSSVFLAGHSAQVQGGTVLVGDNSASSGASNGSLTFDTGTFSANTFELGVHTGSTGQGSGLFTLGGATPNNTASGIFNVNTTFNIARQTSNNTSGTTTGTFTINGATANINSDINDVSTIGTHLGTINLNGGTLNMMGHGIGTNTGTLPGNAVTVNLPATGNTATLSNLGSTGINAAGLNMNGTGTLLLGGTSTYSGNTTVSSGVLAVTGLTPAASTVNVNGGALIGTGTVAGPVVVGGGNLGGGLTTSATSGTLTLSGGLTLNSGNLLFTIGTASSDVINVTGGGVTFNSGALALGLGTGAHPTNGSQFNVLTNSSALSQGGLSLSDTVIGRVTLHPFINGNNLTVSTAGQTANLTWNNSFGVGGDGTSWDSGLGSNQNWNSTAASNPFIFFDGDDVTFNDSNNNHYTVSINTTVQPSSITVNNNSGNYTFNGSTIAGPGALTKSGTAALTINTSNSYSGGTTLNAGTLNLGNISALGTGTFTINAGTIDNTSGSAMQLSNNIPQVWAGNFTFTGSNSLDLGTGGVTLNANPTINVAANSLTVGGAIANGTGSALTKSGTGTLVLSSTTSTYTGNTTINGGAVIVVSAPVATTTASTSSLGSTASGSVTVASGATLDLGGTGSNIANGVYFGTKQFFISGSGVGGLGAIVNTGTTGTAPAAQQNAISKLTLLADSTIGGTARWDLRNNSPVLDLNGFNLTKTGTAQFTLVSATIENSGMSSNTLEAASGLLAIESTAATVGNNGSIVIDSGANLGFFRNSGGGLLWPITLKGNNVVGSEDVTLATVAAPFVLQGDITFEPIGGSVPIQTGSNPLTLTGNISESPGPSSVSFIGNNKTILSGSNNWTGGTFIKSGTFTLGSDTAFPANTALVMGDATISGIGTLDLGGFGANVSSLTTANGGGSNVIANSSTTANSTLTFTTGTSTFDGTIQDSVNGGTKTTALAISSGMLTVTGFSNTYTGGTTVGGGTLVMGNQNAFGQNGAAMAVNSGTLDLNGNSPTFGNLTGSGGVITNSGGSATLTVDTPGSPSYAGSIQGGGQLSLSKQGSGTFTLAGTSSYTGDTNINNGTLSVTGALASSGNVIVNSGATLAGTGTVGNVNHNGGTINPGTAPNTTGTLTANSLTVNSGTLQFDIGTAANNDRITVSGTANFQGGSTLAVSSTNGSFYLTPGTYTLLTSSSLAAGQGGGPGQAPTFAPPMARQTVNLDYATANTIKLDVLNSGQQANLTWKNTAGGDGSSWDIANNKNWISTASILDPNEFYNGDNVTFDDNNNGNYNININQNVTPNSLTVNTANTYTFNGSGIVGATSLTKTGTGTLLLQNNNNAYTGGTFVKNGILKAGSGSALSPNSAITLGDSVSNSSGVLDLNGNTVGVGGLATTGTGAGNIIGNSSTGSGATLVFDGGTSTFGGIIQDHVGAGTQTTALQVATGTLILTANDTYTGGTNVASGATLQLGNNTAAGAVAGDMQVDGTVNFARSNTLTYNGVISGGGSIVQTGPGTTILTNSNNDQRRSDDHQRRHVAVGQWRYDRQASECRSRFPALPACWPSTAPIRSRSPIRLVARLV